MPMIGMPRWLGAYIAQHLPTRSARVFTVHNLAYQGLFSLTDFHLLGLPGRFAAPSALEYHGQLSFMKAGLKFADRHHYGEFKLCP